MLFQPLERFFLHAPGLEDELRLGPHLQDGPGHIFPDQGLEHIRIGFAVGIKGDPHFSRPHRDPSDPQFPAQISEGSHPP